MSWRTNPILIRSRSFGRAVGINRLIARLGSSGYEERYDASLTACIRLGDVVWDIGANVGFYTTQFSNLVGGTGKVVAFEPSPANFARLRAACSTLPNVDLQPCALGNASGQLRFQQGDDALGATSRIVDDDRTADVVDVRVGDDLISDGALPQPTIIKIDVEGFEVEVLEGLVRCIQSTRLRAVGVEVHFGIVSQRGLAQTLAVIEARFQAANFRVTWPDNSHLLAVR